MNPSIQIFFILAYIMIMPTFQKHLQHNFFLLVDFHIFATKKQIHLCKEIFIKKMAQIH
jgi:hypothetical protein